MYYVERFCLNNIKELLLDIRGSLITCLKSRNEFEKPCKILVDKFTPNEFSPEKYEIVFN